MTDAARTQSEADSPTETPTHSGADSTAEAAGRRRFLSAVSSATMLGGLAGGYGLFAGLAGRFLYPSDPVPKGWMFVSQVAGVAAGASINYRSPAGQRIVVTRLRDGESAEDFVALSSTCPHLGCQVHWESHNKRFFCPCHNGAFDASGNAIAGPPKEAGQKLLQYPLKVEDGLLFIEVPLTALS